MQQTHLNNDSVVILLDNAIKFKFSFNGGNGKVLDTVQGDC